MKKVGEILKEYRIDSCKLIREVAAGINIDSAILSKIENGNRLPTEEQLKSLIKYYKADALELNAAYNSDKLYNSLPDKNDLAEESIKMFMQKVYHFRNGINQCLFSEDFQTEKDKDKRGNTKKKNKRGNK